MVSKILQIIKEKRRGVVVVHNKLAAYQDDPFDDDDIIYDSLVETDFDNYLLSFGFLKNTQVHVSILEYGLTAVIIVGDYSDTFEKYEQLQYLFQILHLKRSHYSDLGNILGINLDSLKSKMHIVESLDDQKQRDFSSANLEYKKLIKAYPHFNSKKIHINRTMLATIALVALVSIISIPDIHAQIVIELSEVLSDNGYPNRAFQLCNVADFFKSDKMYANCKLDFLSNLVDPIPLLSSFEEISDKKLAMDLVSKGDNLKKTTSADSRKTLMFYGSALWLTQESDDKNFDENSKKNLEQRSRNGMASVWLESDPPRAISKFKESLILFPNNNIDAKIGLYFATQIIADSQKEDEPEKAKKNYDEVIEDSVSVINELIEIKSNGLTVLDIDCYSNFSQKYLDDVVGSLSSTNKLNDQLVNALRVVAHTCYGLKTLDADVDYGQIPDSATMIIFEKILLDRPSDVKTMMSKAKIHANLAKLTYFENTSNHDLNHAINLYESVVAIEPENNVALKDLIVLYHLLGNDEKKYDIIDRLKNDHVKGDAFIKGIQFFVNSQECDKAEIFYGEATKIIKNNSVLKIMDQKIRDKCFDLS